MRRAYVPLIWRKSTTICVDAAEFANLEGIFTSHRPSVPHCFLSFHSKKISIFAESNRVIILIWVYVHYVAMPWDRHDEDGGNVIELKPHPLCFGLKLMWINENGFWSAWTCVNVCIYVNTILVGVSGGFFCKISTHKWKIIIIESLCSEFSTCAMYSTQATRNGNDIFFWVFHTKENDNNK